MSDTSAPAAPVETLLFEDFTAGLYDLDSSLQVPPNGLRQSDDCAPQREGGLRASFRWLEKTISGVQATIEELIGFYLGRGDHPFGRLFIIIQEDPYGTPMGTDIRLLVAEPNANPLVFTSLATHAATAGLVDGDGAIASAWTTMKTSSFGNVDIFALPLGSVATGARGIYRIVESPNDVYTITKLSSERALALATHQDRLVAAVGGHELKFTNPGLDTPLGNSLFVGNSKGGTIVDLRVVLPGDLYVLSEVSGIIMVQGELKTPIVRDLSRFPVVGIHQWGSEGGGGRVFFQSEFEGLWVIPEVERLSSPIRDRAINEGAWSSTGTGNLERFMGQVFAADRWVFTPKGFVYDTELNAWHKTTFSPSPGTYHFFTRFPRQGDLFAGRVDGTGALHIIVVNPDEQTMARATTYTAKLPPIISAGRRTEIEEVEFHVRSFNAAARIVMNLTGQSSPPAYTRDAIGSGIQVVRVPVHRTSDWWDLAFTISSQAATTEAPFLQRLLVRTQDRTLHEVRLA